MIEMPFKCPECEFSDTTEISYQLKLHFYFHTGVIPYQKGYIILIFEFAFISIFSEYHILIEKAILKKCIVLKGVTSTQWFLIRFKFYAYMYLARVILLQIFFILELIALFYILRITNLLQIFVLYRNVLEDLFRVFPIEPVFTCSECEYNYIHTGELPYQYHINSLISQNDIYHNIAIHYTIYYIQVQHISFSNFSVNVYYYFQINIYVFRFRILICNNKVEKLSILHILQHGLYNLMIFFKITGLKPLNFTVRWTQALNDNLDNREIFYGNIYYLFCFYHRSSLYLREFNWFGLLSFFIYTFFIVIIKLWFKVANLLLFVMLMYCPYSVFLTPFDFFENDLKLIYILFPHLFNSNYEIFILKRAEINIYLPINDHFTYHKNYVTSLHTS